MPRKQALSASKFSDEHIRLVNLFLPRVSADGAYRIGIASALAVQDGLEPTAYLFRLAESAKSVTAAIAVYEKWRDEALAPKAKGKR